MLFGTVFGILVIPSLFIIFQNLHEHFSKTKIVTLDEHLEK